MALKKPPVNSVRTAVLALAVFALASSAASQQTRRGPLEPAQPVNRIARQLALPGLPNFLVILVDDFGVDLINAYGEHPGPAKTPNMDALAAQGLLFRNAYSAPVCSPARAMLMTGRRSRQTGIGLRNPQNSSTAVALEGSFVTLPEMLGDDWIRGAFGKWHLTIEDYGDEFGAGHVTDAGFDHHMGVGWGVINGCEVTKMPQPRGTYTEYCIFVDGLYHGDAGHEITVYNTTNTTDNAVAFISAAIEVNQPFFAYVPYQAPHSPFHIPPASLLSAETNTALIGVDPEDDANAPLVVRAMVEALDTEIGRLLESISGFPESENTYVFLMGDNGTSSKATTLPFVEAHAKGTVFEGGINVPLIVTGPGVMHGESAGLVSVIDMFATMAQLADRPSFSAPDSMSLVPYFEEPKRRTIRERLYVEAFAPNFDPTGPIPVEYSHFEQAIRNDRYKLIRRLTRSGVEEEFYDLATDPYEAFPMDPGSLTGRELENYVELDSTLPGIPDDDVR